MTKAIRIAQNGGPEVLNWETVEVTAPRENEVRIRHAAVGLNFIDVYHRNGLYQVPLPSGLGLEGAGVVEEVGSEVRNLKSGDRVAYAGGPIGAYSETRVMPAAPLVKIPESISDEQAAAMMLQGMTVQYLIRHVFKAKAGDTVLWHAAAGGVGLIACQWLKALGVRVIGTVGTEEKAALAKSHGCAETIIHGRDDIAQRVKALTDGQGVPVVYDSVGKDTWESSLDCLRPRGLVVSFGNSSGAVPPVNLGQLTAKGSLFVTRPTLAHYTSTREDLEATADDLFGVVASGKVKINVTTYPLKDAARAHRDLESRKTTGSIVFIP